MKDHDGNQIPLAEHIRSIIPGQMPNGVTEGIYESLFEMAGLADLPTGRRQEFHLRRAVEFLEKAVESLRCPEDPDQVDEGTAPLPVPAATPGRASPAAGTRLSTAGLRWATARPPSTCPVSGPATDGRRQPAPGSARWALLRLSVRNPAFDAFRVR